MQYDGKTRQQRRWAERRMRKIEDARRRAAIRKERRAQNQKSRFAAVHETHKTEEDNA